MPSFGLHCAALCCTVLHCAALCCTLLHCAALCCTVLHCAALCSLCCTVLHCAALCCTVLHCAALPRRRSTASNHAATQIVLHLLSVCVMGHPIARICFEPSNSTHAHKHQLSPIARICFGQTKPYMHTSTSHPIARICFGPSNTIHAHKHQPPNSTHLFWAIQQHACTQAPATQQHASVLGHPIPHMHTSTSYP